MKMRSAARRAVVLPLPPLRLLPLRLLLRPPLLLVLPAVTGSISGGSPAAGDNNNNLIIILNELSIQSYFKMK